MSLSRLTRKVVVTGGAGVLGREVVSRLSKQGYRVVSFDIAETPGEGRIRGDLKDRAALEEAFSEAFAVCHLAATDENERERGKFAEIDVLGTFNTAEAARKAGVRRFVLASDISVFGVSGKRARRPDYLPIDESHRAEPSEPRAAAKLAAEALARAYHERGELKVTILRLAQFTVGEKAIVIKDGPGALACGIGEARVTVEDAARAVALALQTDTAFGTYIIAARNRYTSEGKLQEPEDALRAIREWGVKSVKADMWHSGSSFSSVKAALELAYDPVF